MEFHIQQWLEACENGQADLVKRAISEGWDVNTQDNDGWTGLMFAVVTGSTEVISLLIDAKADISLKNKKGKSAVDMDTDGNLKPFLANIPKAAANNSAPEAAELKKRYEEILSAANALGGGARTAPAPSRHGTVAHTAPAPSRRDTVAHTAPAPSRHDTVTHNNPPIEEKAVYYKTSSHWARIKDESYDFKQGIEYIRNAFAETGYAHYEEYIALLQQVRNAFQKIADFKTPIKITVSAETSAGKSTFLNALLFGKDVLEATFGETTKAVFEIAYGEQYGVEEAGGSVKSTASIEEFAKWVAEASKNTQFGQKNKIKIYVPSPLLKEGVILYDTPGYSSVNEGVLLDTILSCANDADIVIFLADISRGIKRSDMEIYRRVLFVPEHAKYCYLILNKLDAVAEAEEFEDSVFKGTKADAVKLLKEESAIERLTDKLLSDMKKEIGYAFEKVNVIPLASKQFLTAPKSAYALLFENFQEKLAADIKENKDYFIVMRAELPRRTAAKLVGYIERTFETLLEEHGDYFKTNFPNLKKDFTEFMEELTKDTTTILNIDLYDQKKAAKCFAELDEVIETRPQAIEFAVETVITLKNVKLLALLESVWKPKVNLSLEGSQTLLHYACYSAELSIVDMLLTAGANPLTKDARGLSPLDITLAQNNEQALLPMLPFINLDRDIFNKLYRTNFPQVQNKIFEIILTDKILSSEILTHAIETDDNTLFDRLLEARAAVSAPNKSGDTPIFICITLNRPEMLKKLIAAGADVQAPHWKTGLSPLAHTFNQKVGQAEIALILITAGANPVGTDAQGNYCLIKALPLKNEKLTKSILSSYISQKTYDTGLMKKLIDTQEWGPLKTLVPLSSDHSELLSYAVGLGNMKAVEILMGK